MIAFWIAHRRAITSTPLPARASLASSSPWEQHTTTRIRLSTIRVSSSSRTCPTSDGRCIPSWQRRRIPSLREHGCQAPILRLPAASLPLRRKDHSSQFPCTQVESVLNLISLYPRSSGLRQLAQSPSCRHKPAARSTCIPCKQGDSPSPPYQATEFTPCPFQPSCAESSFSINVYTRIDR